MSQLDRLALCLVLVSSFGASGCDPQCFECTPPNTVVFTGPSPLVIRADRPSSVTFQSHGSGELDVSLESTPPGAFSLGMQRCVPSIPTHTMSHTVFVGLVDDAPLTATGTLRASIGGGRATTLDVVVESPRPHIALYSLESSLSVDLGATGHGSYLLENIGTAELVLSAIVLGEVAPGMELVVGSRDRVATPGRTTFAAPHRLAPGEALEIVGRYTPVTLAHYQQDFELVTNVVDDGDGEEPTFGHFTLNLMGCLASDAPIIDFGDVAVDAVAFADLTLAVCDGSRFVWLKELQIEGLIEGLTPFALAGALELPRAVREPLVVPLSFWPRRAGPFEAQVDIQYSGYLMTTVTLTGRGVR